MHTLRRISLISDSILSSRMKFDSLVCRMNLVFHSFIGTKPQSVITIKGFLTSLSTEECKCSLSTDCVISGTRYSTASCKCLSTVMPSFAFYFIEVLRMTDLEIFYVYFTDADLKVDLLIFFFPSYKFN